MPEIAEIFRDHHKEYFRRNNAPPEVIRTIFDIEKCKQCGLCFPVCPDDAIPVNKEMKREDFNYDYCKGCGVCAKVCPFGAIEMKEEE